MVTIYEVVSGYSHYTTSKDNALYMAHFMISEGWAIATVYRLTIGDTGLTKREVISVIES